MSFFPSEHFALGMLLNELQIWVFFTRVIVWCRRLNLSDELRNPLKIPKNLTNLIFLARYLARGKQNSGLYEQIFDAQQVHTFWNKFGRSCAEIYKERSCKEKRSKEGLEGTWARKWQKGLGRSFIMCWENSFVFLYLILSEDFCYSKIKFKNKPVIAGSVTGHVIFCIYITVEWAKKHNILMHCLQRQ